MQMRAQKVQEYKEKFANPYVAAAKGFIDSVIEPEETRKSLAACPGGIRREECGNACQETWYSTILISDMSKQDKTSSKK